MHSIQAHHARRENEKKTIAPIDIDAHLAKRRSRPCLDMDALLASNGEGELKESGLLVESYEQRSFKKDDVLHVTQSEGVY